MAGPADLAAQAGRGRLRASHADREHVVGVLKTAFVQGMLGKDELDDRVGRAFASRTYADLAALTADLPAGLAPAEPARAAAGRPVLPPGRVLGVATGLYAGTWACGLLLSPHLGDSSLAAALIFRASVTYLGILLVCVSAIVLVRREKRAGGQPPRRPSVGDPGSSSRVASVGPRLEVRGQRPTHRRGAAVERPTGPTSERWTATPAATLRDRLRCA